jgi:hypothetical protein
MKRFSLKFLFTAITVLIVFFGFSQARRRAILREASELSERRAAVEVPHGWIDVVWQRRPSVGRIRWEPYRHEEVEQQMRAMGVYRIEFVVDKK